MAPGSKRRRPHRSKTISEQGVIGQRGIHFIEGTVLEMKSRWTPSGANEVGIDGYIELFDPASREPMGLTLAVQSKVVSSIGEAGPSFDYYCDPNDLEYWLRGNTPVILIVSNPAAQEGYWVWIQDLFRHWKPSAPTKVTFVKSQHRFEATCLKSLAEIASPPQGLYFAPSRRKEFLWSNLLSIEGFAPRIFVGATECRTPRDVWALLNKSKYEPASGWVLWEKKVVSFDDLGSGAWTSVCDRGTVESFDTAEWSNSVDPLRQKQFVQLLNQTLRVQVNPHARYWRDVPIRRTSSKPVRSRTAFAEHEARSRSSRRLRTIPHECPLQPKQAVDMTVCWKGWKTIKLFPHPFHKPWKSLSSDSHISTAATTTGAISP